MVRLVIVLTVAAVVTAMAAFPVMAQQTSGSGNGELIAQANPKAAEKQAAREAARQAKRAEIASQIEAAGYEIPDEAKAGMQGKTETQEKAQEQKKELPKSGGVGSASLLALGAGTLIVGGGLLAYKRARR